MYNHTQQFQLIFGSTLTDDFEMTECSGLVSSPFLRNKHINPDLTPFSDTFKTVVSFDLIRKLF